MPTTTDITIGRKAVLDLLAYDPARLHKVCVAEGSRGAVVRDLIAAARAAGVPVQYMPRRALDRRAPGTAHQGVLAETHAIPTRSLSTLLADLDMAAQPILVACDGITDPHNLGAIVRSAAAAGAGGLLLPARGSAPLSATVRKAAAGALERLPVAKVPNLAKALPLCQAAGFWVLGTAADGETTYFQADLTVPFVLVLGSEGKGLRPLVRKQCDGVIAIPLAPGSDSLNVSVAAGVVLFEAGRQRGGA